MENTQKQAKQTLLFIRHGQTTWNVKGLLPGQLPGIELTDTGREQAQRLAEALKVLPITAVISSPLERARDTANYIAQIQGVDIEFDERLKDTDVGHWAGKDYNKLHQEDPAWKEFTRDPTHAPEGVETFPQVQQRAMAGVEAWLKEHTGGGYAVFVAHADVVKLLLAHYMGLDVARLGSLSIDNASVSIVEIEDEEHSRVIAIGWSPRPGWLKLPDAVSIPPAASDLVPSVEETQSEPSTRDSQT